VTLELVAKFGADLYGLLWGGAVIWLGPRALRVLADLAAALREHSAALRGGTGAGQDAAKRIEEKIDAILEVVTKGPRA
jgi:hypothetical protein